MRLFTGVDLPRAVNANLEQLLAGLRPTAHLKWSPVYNLHITLKFIGEQPESRMASIKEALARVPARKAVPISLRGIEWMPNPHRPRLLWTSIDSPELPPLAADIDAALEPLGIGREDRAYTPHLTLARIRMPVPLDKTRDAVEQLKASNFGSFEADRFWLYLSEPGAANSIYTKLAEFPLTR